MIIAGTHLIPLHGGLQLTTSVLRRKYWVPRLRQLAQTAVKRCVRCVRLRAQTCEQLMGQLPRDRATLALPFQVTGLDYFGPIYLRAWKGRGYQSFKGWVAIFICFATKAVHLELVTDLTVDAFLACYHRFTSRRGRPTKLWSDNALTFQGANNLLGYLEEMSSDYLQRLFSIVAQEGTQWNFIPPHAPHFGGLWEENIRSVKHHVTRVIGQTSLTYEEMSTLLMIVEACLNSRPLTPLKADPNCYEAITPGQLLIGKHLLAAPEDLALIEDPSPRDRWDVVQQQLQNFWRHWSSDYIHTLQQRVRW